MCAPPPPTCRESRRLHSIDVFQFEYTDDVQISPDGSRIVYVRVSHDIMTDRARRNLWIVNADGTNNRPLRSEARNFSSPRWSPDGARLAYVSAAEGSPQLYVRWMDSGQTALLTNLVKAPGAIAWSADGKSIAFTQLVPVKKPPLATPPEKPEGAQWAPPVKVIDSVVYRADGAGYLEAGYQHVFVVSAEGGTPRQLTDGEFNDDGPLSFTPDSKRVVFSANRGADWERDPQESDVFTVDIATQKLTQLTTRDGPDNSPVVSPDGRKIAYLGFDDRLQGYQVTHLYVMDIDGKNSRVVTAGFDRDVADPRWSADSRSVYFSYDERGVTKAWSRDAGRQSAHAGRRARRHGSRPSVYLGQVQRRAQRPCRLPAQHPGASRGRGHRGRQVRCACSPRSTTTCSETRRSARSGRSPGSPRRTSARSRAG